MFDRNFQSRLEKLGSPIELELANKIKSRTVWASRGCRWVSCNVLTRIPVVRVLPSGTSPRVPPFPFRSSADPSYPLANLGTVLSGRPRFCWKIKLFCKIIPHFCCRLLILTWLILFLRIFYIIADKEKTFKTGIIFFSKQWNEEKHWSFPFFSKKIRNDCNNLTLILLIFRKNTEFFFLFFYTKYKKTKCKNKSRF